MTLEDDVVFAGCEVRAVGLDAARQDQRRGLAAGDSVADFHPREFFHPDAVECVDGPWRLHLGFALCGQRRLLFGRHWRPLIASARWRLCQRGSCQCGAGKTQSDQSLCIFIADLSTGKAVRA